MENTRIRARQEIEQIDFQQYKQSLDNELRLHEARRLSSQGFSYPAYSISTRRLEVFEKLVHERIRLRRTSIESVPQLSSASNLADLRSELVHMMEHTFEAISRAVRQNGMASGTVVAGIDEWEDERIRLGRLINSELRRIELEAELEKGSTMQDLEPRITAPSEPRWDVFISHASEDKDSVARPLCQMLREKGLRVWIDEAELRMGDSLRQKIDEGLAHSRYGVVVLSQSFFSKDWPRLELNGLVAREVDGEKVILLVWHEVDKAYVTGFSPTLADRLAGKTANGLERVVADILNAISPADDTAAIIHPTQSDAPDLPTPHVLPGLTKFDTTVFKLACELTLQQDHEHVSGEALEERLADSGASLQEIVETLDVLEHNRCIEIHRVLGPVHVYGFRITVHGFEQFAQCFFNGYEELRHDVERCIVNDGLMKGQLIAEKLGQPIRIVQHVFEVLKREGLLSYSEYQGGESEIHEFSPVLKRRVRAK